MIGRTPTFGMKSGRPLLESAPPPPLAASRMLLGVRSRCTMPCQGHENKHGEGVESGAHPER